MAVPSLVDLEPMETRVMKVVTLKNIPNVPAEGAAEQTAGWTGPVSRTRQTIIKPIVN
jgi:hypothetical protein